MKKFVYFVMFMMLVGSVSAATLHGAKDYQPVSGSDKAAPGTNPEAQKYYAVQIGNQVITERAASQDQAHSRINEFITEHNTKNKDVTGFTALPTADKAKVYEYNKAQYDFINQYTKEALYAAEGEVGFRLRGDGNAKAVAQESGRYFVYDDKKYNIDHTDVRFKDGSYFYNQEQIEFKGDSYVVGKDNDAKTYTVYRDGDNIIGESLVTLGKDGKPAEYTLIDASGEKIFETTPEAGQALFGSSVTPQTFVEAKLLREFKAPVEAGKVTKEGGVYSWQTSRGDAKLEVAGEGRKVTIGGGITGQSVSTYDASGDIRTYTYKAGTDEAVEVVYGNNGKATINVAGQVLSGFDVNADGSYTGRIPIEREGSGVNWRTRQGVDGYEFFGDTEEGIEYRRNTETGAIEKRISSDINWQDPKWQATGLVPSSDWQSSSLPEELQELQWRTHTPVTNPELIEPREGAPNPETLPQEQIAYERVQLDGKTYARIDGNFYEEVSSGQLRPLTPEETPARLQSGWLEAQWTDEQVGSVTLEKATVDGTTYYRSKATGAIMVRGEGGEGWVSASLSEVAEGQGREVRISPNGEILIKNAKGHWTTCKSDCAKFAKPLREAMSQKAARETSIRRPSTTIFTKLNEFLKGYQEFSGLGFWSGLFIDDEEIARKKNEYKESFCDTVLLGDAKCWTSKICEAKVDNSMGGSGVISQSGIGATPRAAARIEATRSAPIEVFNSSSNSWTSQYLYRISYSVRNVNEDNMFYNIVLLDDQGTVYRAFFDGKELRKGASRQAVHSRAETRYCSRAYTQVCLTMTPGIERMGGGTVTELCNSIVAQGGVGRETASIQGTGATSPASAEGDWDGC